MPKRTDSTVRPRDAAKTKEKLIESAAEIFNQVGFWGTDTNRIARAAGYAPATLYKHFPDKRAVFLAAYAQWVDAEWHSIRLEARSQSTARHSPRRIVEIVIDHHRRWAVFRRSLRALAATDEVVRNFRRASQQQQIDLMGGLLAAAGASRRSRADCLFALLCFERVCDAVADGDDDFLGVGRHQLTRRLVALVLALADRSLE